MQEIQDDDPEVRAEVKVQVTALHEGRLPYRKTQSLISDWARMKRTVAWILKYKQMLISRARHQPSHCTTKALSPTDLDVSLLEYAQHKIIRLHQQQVFSIEREHLRDGTTGEMKLLHRTGGIYNLDLYIDEKVC